MSKTGQWVFEMQEDAEWMSRAVFVRKHGVSQVAVWEEVQQAKLGYEPDYEPY